MASSPDFSQDTKDTLAARSAHICNFPKCGKLTVGPSDAQGDLALNLGEAAHIRHDQELKSIIKEIRSELMQFMNFTGNYGDNQWDELKTTRSHVGVSLARLRDEYGCVISGHLNSILPKPV